MNMYSGKAVSVSGKAGFFKGDGNTIGATSQISNGENSTTIDIQPSNGNFKREFTSSASKERHSAVFPLVSNNGLSEENQVRIRSMLPKTAANFHKMKKGLFLNPIKGFPYNI